MFALLALLAVWLDLAAAQFPDCVNGPLATNLVCDTSANYTARAAALVANLTLEEVAANLDNTAPGVPRLGLPTYNWWSEALHGVASSPGVTYAPAGEPFSFATSFPQPILMGAAFDDDLIHAVATVVSTEARAFNNANRSGLDYFTPNINPFKDPRWGRGQETPGEDPTHIARYVYSLVTGLQGGVGPDPYYKVVADCKHFAGYDLEDWEGNVRYGFDAIITQQDLSEFYTPSFKSCVRDAKVGSVMCSYNAVNGIPSCASSFLLQDLIRDFFGLADSDGWITSDCDAVDNVFDPHAYTTTLVNATAVSIKAGTDVDCGTSYGSSLVAAVNGSLVDETSVRTALTRLYGSLVRLGYFDPPANQPFRSLGWDDVNTPDSQALAFTAAASGIVLLKNDGLLPLSNTSTPNIALIGPWANATTQMQGNYEGPPPFFITPLQGLQDAGFNVTFSQGTSVDDPLTDGFPPAMAAAQDADVIVFAGGIDNSVEAEGMDRTNITWTYNQLQLIGQLAELGVPMVVLQMGGGQVDSSTLKANDAINALIWGGYPGQAGGAALAAIISGAVAPAGRLPITQYPASYVDEVPMTDMNLRPSATNPGRTYKWYTGTPVFEFGTGLHYTNFTLSWAAPPPSSFAIADLMSAASEAAHPDIATLFNFTVNVANTGAVDSDYVALLFSNTTAGPQPAPLKTLISYARAHDVVAGGSSNVTLSVPLGQIARVDENGNSVLYPGTYNVWVDIDGSLATSFELTGDETTLLTWPQPSD
ncbi:glycoside hydrolase family 3 protein [Peniophora sp. CONT]|nr:glycoside hydrolase family 3 protein [Peniophora sp. CONT]